MIKFLHPELLWLLLAIPLLAWLLGRKSRSSAMLFPTTSIAAILGKNSHQNPLRWLTHLRLLTLVLMIIAISRPQMGRYQSEIDASGIDIILALDVSTSMDALDFKLKGREVRRIEAVKAAVEKFILDRPNDRIALLMFAAKPYLMSPLTLDHNFLLDRLYNIDTGIIEDQTAIGTALARSIRQLTDREAKSKVVVLLTDGENNAGKISPIQAAETAVPLNVRVYTIGAGTRGIAHMIRKDRFGRNVRVQGEVNIDEETLTQIADTTGGRYFRATDLNELKAVYAEIDQLEKSTRTIQGFTLEKELFPFLLIAGLILLFIEILLSQTRMLKIP